MVKTYNIVNDLLNNDDFIKWYKGELTDYTLVVTRNKDTLADSKEIERLFGNRMIGTENNIGWSGILGENAVKLLLEKLGHINVHKITKDKDNADKNKYKPDLECDCENTTCLDGVCDGVIWEVKCRNWTTTGTAGEKILGTPLKYSEVPLLYSKPLKIITIGFQEHEAKELFKCGNLLDKVGNENFNQILELFNNLNIKYVGFTDLMEKLNENSSN